MSATLRQSQVRLSIGGGLALLAILVAAFVLPAVSDRLASEERARRNSEAALARQRRGMEEDT